ncbi:hypothetical protein HN587_05730 [Candidatus Woesearchaeota archaeon]|jgi:HTH-type transcriptional regulator, sugar sensing transcriptional regulator|nr:hypothetical protein [Candidatus Woesearchaeota archaeon]
MVANNSNTGKGINSSTNAVASTGASTKSSTASNDPEIMSALKEFGLTDKELKVYLALIKQGSSLVTELSQSAGTYRTYTYEILNSLKEKGLVNSVVKSGKQFFEAEQPEKLLSILTTRTERISKIIPDLNSMFQSTYQKPQISIYEGDLGLKSVLENVLKQSNEKNQAELLIYGSSNKQIKLFESVFTGFTKKRVKKKICEKIITEMSKEGITFQKSDQDNLRETRLIPKEMNLPTTTLIYGDTVVFISRDHGLFCVMFQSKSLADTQRIVFDLFWKAIGR